MQSNHTTSKQSLSDVVNQTSQLYAEFHGIKVASLISLLLEKGATIAEIAQAYSGTAKGKQLKSQKSTIFQIIAKYGGAK